MTSGHRWHEYSCPGCHHTVIAIGQIGALVCRSCGKLYTAGRVVARAEVHVILVPLGKPEAVDQHLGGDKIGSREE